MSEAVTALDGKRFSGLIEVEDAGLIGMVTLRADLGDAAVTKALSGAGFEVPGQRRVTGGLGGGALWMSPDELMLLCPHGEADALATSLTETMSDSHAMVVNVSDARSVLRLSGEGVLIREVLAKVSPANLRPTALPQGEVRRTRLAQVPGAFWFAGEGEAVVIAFRSVGEYVFELLSKVSEEGSAVGYFKS